MLKLDFLDLCLVIQEKGKGFYKSDFLDKSLEINFKISL